MTPSQTLSAAVKSVEDHGYILDFGINDVSGFLSFAEAEKSASVSASRFRAGHLLNVCVSKMSANGRTCTVTNNEDSVKAALVRS